MAAAGIDTWSVCWYLRDHPSESGAMDALATGRAGRYSMLPDKVRGHRVIWDRSNRLVMAEGHPVEGELAPMNAELLVDATEAIAGGISDLGVKFDKHPRRFEHQGSPGCGGIRRIDLACDLVRQGDVGRAILSGIAGLEAPGLLRSTIHRAHDHAIETVTWEGSRGKMARAYDKGAESGSHPPGQRVRLEDQRRFEKGHRHQPDEVAKEFASWLFTQRFKTIWAAKKGLTVTTLGPAIDKVQEAVRAGEMTPASAYKVIGYLVAEQRGTQFGARMTRYRHREKARELGLVLVDGASGEIEIDLAEETAEAREASWG